MLRGKGEGKREEIKEPIEEEREQGTTLENSKVGKGDVSTDLLYAGKK